MVPPVVCTKIALAVTLAAFVGLRLGVGRLCSADGVIVVIIFRFSSCAHI